MNTKGWIAAGAASALGIGVIASGALTVANAMPLYDSSTATDVPPISTAQAETKAFTGTGDVRFWVTPTPATATTVLTPTPATTATPTVVTPSPATPPTVQPAPAPAPQPVAPPPPGSVDSPASAASVPSPASPASDD